MIAQSIRCQNDLELSKKLLEHPDVKHIKNMIARMEGKAPMGLRRRLLSSSVRLSREMAPDIHRIADQCIETLGMKIPLELYVFPSPQFNAMCFKPEGGRLFVMFASSLLESFTQGELRFVMGHELGHHIYGHHDIPIGYLLVDVANTVPVGSDRLERGNEPIHELAEAGEILQKRVQSKLMIDGVTIVSPSNTFIDPRVAIGRDTVIMPFSVIEGPSSIGEGCRIGPFAHIPAGSAIADGTEIAGLRECQM